MSTRIDGGVTTVSIKDELISRPSSATMLQSVSDVQSRVPVLGAQLGFGDLTIFTQSGNAGADHFRTITHPKTFRDRLMATKMRAVGGTAASPAPVAPPPAAPVTAPAAPAASDQLQTLARLAELRDSGAITSEEFEAKKTELLSRI